MKRLATLLIIAIGLAVIGCQPPAGTVVTPEQLDAVKTELSTLKSDFEALRADFDSLRAQYTAHLEKHHKGAAKPPTGERPGGLKPPTVK